MPLYCRISGVEASGCIERDSYYRVASEAGEIDDGAAAGQEAAQVIDLAQMIVEMALQMSEKLARRNGFTQHSLGKVERELLARERGNHLRDQYAHLFDPCDEIGRG